MGRDQKHEITADRVDVYVYIGPTIRSAVQHGSIFPGPRENAEKKLAAAIEKFPPIRMLLVSGEELAVARKQLKQPGNRLYEINRRFFSELTK